MNKSGIPAWNGRSGNNGRDKGGIILNRKHTSNARLISNVENKTKAGNMRLTPVLDLLYPRRCPVCQDIVASHDRGMLICPSCRKRLPYVQEPRCLKCGKEISKEEQEYCGDCRLHPKHYSKGFPLFSYTDPIQDGIQAFKYHNRREYAQFYGEALLERFGTEFRALKLDGILPVPLHRRRFRRRGYNQAELIAAELGRGLMVPVYSGLLIRIVDTVPQKELNDRERMENLKRAFHFHKNKVELNRLLLVDDIYTTGATIEACTQELLQAGIKEVFCTSVCIGKGL